MVFQQLARRTRAVSRVLLLVLGYIVYAIRHVLLLV
jgi:hypothetical protein